MYVAVVTVCGGNRMGDAPLSYKQFMLELEDDVSPTDALSK